MPDHTAPHYLVTLHLIGGKTIRALVEKGNPILDAIDEASVLDVTLVGERLVVNMDNVLWATVSPRGRREDLKRNLRDHMEELVATWW